MQTIILISKASMDKMGLGVWSLVFTCGCFLMVSGTGNCPWSTKTLKEVSSCPTNKTAVDLRKESMKCEIWANRQNCTTPEKFSYHCLMNEYGNALVEVCAPEYFIYGYCAEYNTVGERIHPHYSMKCSDVTPPCESRYISTDAYLYKGCYAAVKRDQTVTSGDITPTTQPGHGLEKAAIGGIIASVIVIIILIAVIIIFIREKRRQNEMRNYEASTHLMSVTENGGNCDINLIEDCDQRHYKTTIIRGRVLRDTILSKAKRKNGTLVDIEGKQEENMKENLRRTMSYLKAYEKVNKYYVETELTKECKRKLEEFGMVVLIGPQGAGKTLTSVHIMSNEPYKKWIKRKVTSWEDLLVMEFEDNTLVYIDNLFDGFLYQQKVDKWLDSLCYFYFECIKQKCNIRLMITTKKDVLERVCSFIKTDTQTLIKTCSVQDDLFPLSYVEKMNILERQIELAREIKKINVHFTRETLKHQLQSKTCPIGFPLCAHMYAFEGRKQFRDASIFDNPRFYVKNHIHNEIEEDKTHGVKTLFLLLVFCCSPEAVNSSGNLNFIYGRECEDFLRAKSSDELLKALDPLSFDNLNERANELEDNVLIKHHKMFEFKHQIYLEGVSDYFFLRYFNAVVDHFPLNILRTYEMHDNSKDELSKLVGRILREITKGAISEALSCKVFKEPGFEQEVCNALQDDVVANLLSTTDNTSGYEFPTIFWANKYKLKKLSQLLLDFVRSRNIDYPLQVCLAKFGDCCAHDENYITKAKFPLTIKNLQSLVDNSERQ